MREINENEFCQTVIINEAQFKRYCTAVTVMDYEYLEPYIAIAQELHISPFIGDRKLNELKFQVATDMVTIENKKIIDVIAPCLAYYAIYQSIPFHWSNLSSIHIDLNVSEDDVIYNGAKDMPTLRRFVKDRADKLKADVADLLTKI